MNGGIGKRWLPSPFASGRRQPGQVFIGPEKELPSLLEGLVVGLPDGGVVFGREGLAHAIILLGVGKFRLMQQSRLAGEYFSRRKFLRTVDSL